MTTYDARIYHELLMPKPSRKPTSRIFNRAILAFRRCNRSVQWRLPGAPFAIELALVARAGYQPVDGEHGDACAEGVVQPPRARP